MSQSVEPLRASKPKAAEFIESWQNKFEKDYDFSKMEDKANFVEAMQTIASFIATESKNGTARLSLSSDGITAVTVQSSPTS